MTKDRKPRRDKDEARSVFVACEANAAQDATQPTRAKVVTTRVIMAGFLFIIIGLMINPSLISVPIFGLVWFLWFVICAVLAAIYDVREKRKESQFLPALAELYPASDLADYAELEIQPRQMGLDGTTHEYDRGFLTLEGDQLRWRGVWFQCVILRSDIERVRPRGFAFATSHLVLIKKARVGNIRCILFSEMPHGKTTYSMRIKPRLHSWQGPIYLPRSRHS